MQLCSCSLESLLVPHSPARSWKGNHGSTGVVQGMLVTKPRCCWYYGVCVSFDSVCVGFKEAGDLISNNLQAERLWKKPKLELFSLGGFFWEKNVVLILILIFLSHQKNCSCKDA